jgi:hypothetical protein
MAAFFGAAGLSYGLSLLGYILYSEATDFYDRKVR